MKNSVNINTAEWCNMIFEGKNKEYGAYTMRQTAGERYLFAFGILIILIALAVFIPSLINNLKAEITTRSEGITETYSTILVDNKVEIPEPEVIKPTIPEPPKLMNMKKFVPPTIVNDTEAPEETTMVTMTEVTTSKEAIGAFNVTEGSNDKDAIRKEVETIMGSSTVEAIAPPQTFINAEIMPQYPGGEVDMYKYIGENLKYPVPDQEMGIQGRVIVRFIVTKTGDISGLELLKGISPTCDKEAMRVIKSMPKWIPGKQNGEPVQVYYTIPIVFKLKS